MEWEAIQGTPTIMPTVEFNPLEDAAKLRKAMRDILTDEDALVDVLCHRTYAQRQDIKKAFKAAYKRDLEKLIKSETSKNFERVLLALLMTRTTLYCTSLKEAMAGLGADEDTIIEIFVTLPSTLIKEINKAYPKMYRKSLDSALKSETSGTFRALLLGLLSGQRDGSGDIDVRKAQADAYDLYKAGNGRIGTDKDTFNHIFCQRNYQQLQLTFQEYTRKMGRSMDKVIESEFSGDSKQLLLAIYKCVTSKADYFAECIYNCRSTFLNRTNNKTLIRIIVTRCDIDLGDIKKSFERLYKKTLKNFVKDETAGDYRKALLALMNER